MEVGKPVLVVQAKPDEFEECKKQLDLIKFHLEKGDTIYIKSPDKELFYSLPENAITIEPTTDPEILRYTFEYTIHTQQYDLVLFCHPTVDTHGYMYYVDFNIKPRE